MAKDNIRNFCIIAHIDHGKSTLADRFLEITGTMAKEDIKEQVLDDMDLERERGITIKAHPVRMDYTTKDGREYQFNLIDTPGHVDFTYEVSRSLSACEGAILVVDATQGVEAQTIANLHLALEHDIEIIPVINKIDLPNADIENVTHQIVDVIGLARNEILLASAKRGTGAREILDAIAERVPPPKPQKFSELRALIFDSSYNIYRGVAVYIRVFSGKITRGMKIRMMSNGLTYEVEDIGVFKPKMTSIEKLEEGEVGYILANIKNASSIKIGDTITDDRKPAPEPLPGFKEVQPMVFSGLYPSDGAEYETLKDSLEKLRLNDASFIFEPETSAALGFGFRCGFLGLLHLEVIFERIHREFGISTITTHPSVIYKVKLENGEEINVDNPVHFPEPHLIESIYEPYILAFIIVPNECIGAIMQLGLERRGQCVKTQSIDTKRVMLEFEFPLNEVIVDFFDRLKSITHGYGSLDYEFLDYREGDLVKLDILINGDPVDAFSSIVHKSKAEFRGRQILKKLKEVMPNQLFAVALQAAIGGKIIARENVKALKKDVTAKCYGGDITRKRKLWEKQKEGKKRMKQIGKVNLPQNVFVEVLKA
mgnify:CR=1 FL=1